MEVKFFGAHTLVWTHRVVEHLSGPNKGKVSEENAFHLCSLKRGGHTANAFAKAVRRHWSAAWTTARSSRNGCRRTPDVVLRMVTQRTGRKTNGQN